MIGDDHFLFGDQVLDAHVAVVAHEHLGAAVVAVLLDDLGEFLGDDGALALRVGDDRLEFGDHELELGVAVLDLLAFQGGQAAQLHVEDGAGLEIVDVAAVPSGPRVPRRWWRSGGSAR